jgi:hypothetical protein
MNEKIKCTVYVDDTLLCYPKESYILIAIEALKKDNMELEV